MSVPVLKSMKQPVPAGFEEYEYGHSEVPQRKKAIPGMRTPVDARLTVRLLRVSLGQALVPDQCRLLISNQPGNRDALEQVPLLELAVHFAVADDPRERLARHVEKVAQFAAPVLLVQVVQESSARVRGVGNVQAAVLCAGELLPSGTRASAVNILPWFRPEWFRRTLETHVNEPSVDRSHHQRLFSPRLLNRLDVVLEPVPFGRRKVGSAPSGKSVSVSIHGRGAPHARV